MNSGSEVMPHARFLTKQHCSLCERAYPILERLVAEGRITLERVDIESDPQLVEQYGTRIPVILLSTGETFEGRISEYRLRRALDR